MKIDTWLRATADEAAEKARRAENLGYDGGFTSESSHDAFLAVPAAAEHTERIELTTNIAVAFARSPLDLAQMANDLQAMSRGRFVLGLGSQIRPHIENRYGMPWSRPVARMGEIVTAIKAIQRSWADGTPLEFRGELYRHTLMTPFFNPGPNPYGPPPVYVAGLGPRMTAKAAEVADGLLVHPLNTERYVRDRTAVAVKEGLARSGRARDTFTVAVTAIVATGLDDEELARAEAGVRTLIAFYSSTPAYRVVLDVHGLGDLQTELNVLSKQGRWAEMNDLVTDDVLETLAVRGSPREAAEKVAARYRDLADRVSWSAPYQMSDDCEVAMLEALRDCLA